MLDADLAGTGWGGWAQAGRLRRSDDAASASVKPIALCEFELNHLAQQPGR